MKLVFADTVYWIALLLEKDPWFDVAVETSRNLGDVHLVTTEEVLIEFLAAVSRAGKQTREVAAEKVRDLLTDPAVTVHVQSHESFLSGLYLYEQRLDKGYSLVDCVSMERMRLERIGEVLTADRHFEQEGFHTLMRT